MLTTLCYAKQGPTVSDETKGELIWHLAAYAGLTGVALLTLLGLYLFARPLHQRWFPLQRLRRVRWRGHDVILAFFALIGGPVVITLLLLQIVFFQVLIGPEPANRPPDDAFTTYLSRCQQISGPLILAVTLATIFGTFYARTDSRPHHYGMTWSRWPANIALGMVAFIAASPIVFGTFALASLVLLQHPSHIKAFAKSLEDWEWVFFGFQVIVMAPLLEEIVFRGILQGWLRRASLLGHMIILGVTLYQAVANMNYRDATNTNEFDPGPLVFALVLDAGYVYALFRMTRYFDLDQAELEQWQVRPLLGDGRDTLLLAELTESPVPGLSWEQAREHEALRARRWAHANGILAIYGSAMLFAIFHSSNWPAPIALFPMGLVSGWLYHRTQSLIGPITFHAFFNFVTLIALYGMTMDAQG